MAKKTTDAAPASGAAVTHEVVYDSSGRAIATKEAGDSRWFCTFFDSRGRVASTTDSSASHYQTTYNYHDPTDLSPAPGTTDVTAHDSTGASHTTTTVVDLLGRTISYTDEQGTVTRTVYDQAGRATDVYRTLPGDAEKHELSTAYDDSSRITSQTEYLTNLTTGSTTSFSYDSAGRPTTTSRPTSPNPLIDTTSYDANTGRVSSLTHTVSATTLWSDALGYTKAGKINHDAATNVTRDYSFDAAGRLTQTNENSSPVRAYSYDANTNRCALTVSTQTGCNGSPTVADVSFTGASGNYIDTPDSAALSVTGDIDLRLKVKLTDWTPTAWAGLIGKTTSPWPTNHSYGLEVDPTGHLAFSWSPNGSTGKSANSTVPVGAADGSTTWVRVTLKVNNGSGGNTTTFYTSPNGVTWTQLGTAVTQTGTTSIFDNTYPLELGYWPDGGEYLNGKLYSAQVYNGIDGTRVADFEAANLNPNAASPYTDANSNVWTFHGSPTVDTTTNPTGYTYDNADRLIAGPAGTGYTYDANGNMTVSPENRLTVNDVTMPGTTGNYIDTPDTAALSITGDLDVRVKLSLDNWGSNVDFFSKWGTTDGNVSWDFYTNTDSKLHFAASVNGHFATLFTADSTAAYAISNGATKWVRATLKANNGAGGADVKFYLSDDGNTWTQLGSTVTFTGTKSIFDSTAPLAAFGIGGGASGPGKLYAAEVLNGINGTRVADFEATDLDPTNPSAYTDTVGVPWTFHGSAWHADTATDLAMPGTVGNYLDAPDSTALSITGDIDLRAKVQLNNWSPANCIAPITKATTYPTNYSYALEICGDNKLYFTWSANGTTTNGVGSTVVTGLNNGATKWIRATLKVNNGASGRDIKYYLSDDGNTWTQLGTTITQTGTTSIFNNTSNVYLGNWANNTEWIDGKLYAAQIYNGINGTKVADFEATSLNPASPSPWTDATGTTWTLHGTGSTVETTATTPTNLTITYDSYNHATSINDGTNTTTETLAPSGRVLEHKQTRNNDSAVLDDTIYGYANDNDSPNWSQPKAGGVNTTYLGDRTITQTSPSTPGTPTYFIANPHGDITRTTTAGAVFAANPPTDEFGNEATTPTNRLGWIGTKERFSSQDNVIRMGVRLYDPSTGRFLSQDSIEAGNANDYVYPQDPINGIDLDGRVGSGMAPCDIHRKSCKRTWKIAKRNQRKIARVVAALTSLGLSMA